MAAAAQPRLPFKPLKAAAPAALIAPAEQAALDAVQRSFEPPLLARLLRAQNSSWTVCRAYLQFMAMPTLGPAAVLSIRQPATADELERVVQLGGRGLDGLGWLLGLGGQPSIQLTACPLQVEAALRLVYINQGVILQPAQVVYLAVGMLIRDTPPGLAAGAPPELPANAHWALANYVRAVAGPCANAHVGQRGRLRAHVEHSVPAHKLLMVCGLYLAEAAPSQSHHAGCAAAYYWAEVEVVRRAREWLRLDNKAGRLFGDRPPTRDEQRALLRSEDTALKCLLVSLGLKRTFMYLPQPLVPNESTLRCWVLEFVMAVLGPLLLQGLVCQVCHVYYPLAEFRGQPAGTHSCCRSCSARQNGCCAHCQAPMA